MATITLADRSASVTRIKPATGAPSGLLSPHENDAPVFAAVETYTAATARAANDVIALMFFANPVRVINGNVFVSGAATSATLTLGVVADGTTLDDATIDVLAAAIPVQATPGDYPVLGGLNSGSGKPANKYYDIPANSYVVARLNTAGLNSGGVIKLNLNYIKKW